MKYIAYYDIKKYASENRKYVLAAVNKMQYICNALHSVGENVDIISVSGTKNKKFCRGRVDKLDFGSLKCFPSFPNLNALFRRIDSIFIRICLFGYLLKNAKKNENVIVYHGVDYGNAIAWAKKIKGFKLILEVEEIYQDVNSLGKRKNKREYRDFEIADKYIFPTELLNKKLNYKNKPYCIIHGTYQVEPDRGESFNDGKIHVVYAGTFDSRKGGGAAAAAAAEWLPENYHVHILGFGSEKDKAAIIKIIEDVNKTSKAEVTFGGTLSGEEYIRFIQKCHIGLSTQNPNAAFNSTSYPSKILSYMSNGLRVVSINIPAIKDSAVGNDLYYYENQTPEEIAKAIMSVDLNDNYDGRKIIEKLDEKFKRDIERLIKE